MPKIVIVGSCRFAPYEVLIVPNPWNNHVKKLLTVNHEQAARLAEKRFHPAIDKCDEVWVYAPDGIGKHTQRDIDYARKNGKKILLLDAGSSKGQKGSVEGLSKIIGEVEHGNV